MNRTCKITNQPFIIDDLEQSILRRFSELIPALNGASLPLPTVHPHEELRRIFAFGALRKLYKATSIVSGKSQLTRYNPALGTTICTYDEFYSDSVDNTETGRPYDFGRPFIEQWQALLYSATLPPLNNSKCEESDYVNGGEELFRCYLCFACNVGQDCLYCLFCSKIRDCIDCLFCKECELCFSSRDLTGCYETHNSSDCAYSQNLFGCVDCRSCRNCYGCVGLEHASYQIFNTPVSREAYEQFISSKRLNSRSGRLNAAHECRAFAASLGSSVQTLTDCTNSTGAYLSRCIDCTEVYNGISSQQCGYMARCENSHQCYRGGAVNCELVYSSLAFQSRLNAFCYSVFGGECNFYSAFLVQNCSNCFGCIALRGKSYCILNRQYTRDEYMDLVPRILAQMRSEGVWGEWFPPTIAPHSYQESSVSELLSAIPLESARSRGYRVIDEPPIMLSDGSINAQDLPDTIDPNKLELLLAPSIVCEESGQLYKFQRRELEFYLRNGVPLPRTHWNQRLQALLNDRTRIPAA